MSRSGASRRSTTAPRSTRAASRILAALHGPPGRAGGPAKPVLATATVLLVLLAGCSGSSQTAAPQETVPQGDVKTEDGDIVRADLGALRGRVRDDVNFSLEGARVSLLGTDHFASTSEDGTFRILNITAGEHTMRVLKKDFVPHEKTVTIEPGASTRLDIMLLPKTPRAGGMQPHLHDFWSGQDTYTVMDAPFDPADQDLRGSVQGPVANNSLVRIPLPPSEPGHPSIVLPGTKEIRITLDWSETTQTLDDLGIAYDPPENRGFIPGFWAIALDGRGPGEAHTIPVEPEQQDNGHQLWTDWRFFLHYDNGVQEETTDYGPPLMQGDIHVRIELVRGDVVLDPPHTDHWGSNKSLVLHGDKRNGASTGGNRPYLTLDKESGIIPPGTARMRFTLSWEYDRLPDDPVTMQVAVLTADQNPDTTRFSELHRFEATRDGQSLTVETDVEPEWADPYYESWSGWRWYLHYDEEPDREDSGWVFPDTVEFSVDVEIWKVQDA